MTSQAISTLERIEKHCLENFGQYQSWKYQKLRYFFEENPEDEPDGAIIGTISEEHGKFAKIVSNFRIEPNGEISQGDFGFKELSPNQNVKVIEEKQQIEVVEVRKQIEVVETKQENPIEITEDEEKPLFRVMDASQIGMVESKNDLVKASMMVKGVWGIDAGTITCEQEQRKQLHLENEKRSKATYPLKYLLESVKFAEKQKATHIILDVGTNKPLKLSFASNDSKGAEKETAFYLAPRIDVD